MDIAIKTFIAFLLLAFSYSCEKVAETDPAHKGPLRPQVPTEQVSGKVIKKEKYIIGKNKTLSYMHNLKVARTKADKVLELEKLYMDKMATIPVVDGRRDKNKVRPIFTEMREKIKKELGAKKYDEYNAYKQWLGQRKKS